MAKNFNVNDYSKILVKTLGELKQYSTFKSYDNLRQQLIEIQEEWSKSKDLVDQLSTKRTLEEIFGEFIKKFEEECKAKELDNEKRQEILNRAQKIIGEAMVKIEQIPIAPIEQAPKGFLKNISAFKTKNQPQVTINQQKPQRASYWQYAQHAKVTALDLQPQQKTKSLMQLFNDKEIKPKKFFEISTKDLPDAESIATFLHSPEIDGVHLNKAKIGEYLGELDLTGPNAKKNEENKAILTAYVEKFDFKNQPFLDALRTFLDAFRLPGEAQKIDRIMDTFSQKFCKEDKDKDFQNKDAVYALAFSVIMLNTDAHNPNIKEERKMTQEQFIKNNREMNDGKNFNPEFLKKIYNGIKTKEIKFKETAEEGTMKATKKPKMGME